MRRIFNFSGIVPIIMSIALISCNDDDSKDSGNNNCNVSDPAEEIGWLKEAIDNVKQDEYSYYDMANYKGETVFFYGNCNPAVTYISIIQSCSGDTLGFTYDLYDELTNITTLWKHYDSKCTFEN